MDMMENYKRWLGKVTEEDLLTELKAIEGKEEEINDRFYRDLEFGTGGLRGVIGAGTFRINEHTQPIVPVCCETSDSPICAEVRQEGVPGK